MTQQISHIHRKIMRRVYYAYALRLVTHPLVVRTAVLFASVFVLSRLVHVASIISNISNLRVGDLGSYILNTFMHTELLTLAVTGVVIFTLLSIPLSFRSVRTHTVKTA